MKTIAIVVLTFCAGVVATAGELATVSATIQGARATFSSEQAGKITQGSVALLASCSYLNPKPRWGAGPTEPQSLSDAKKQSHLHLAFSKPHKVEISTEKVTLQVRELVVTLPLNTAGIWVRTDDKVVYLAMFERTAAENLQKLLDESTP